MEVIAGWTHKAFPIDDPSRVGEARRYAAQLAEQGALNVTEAGRLALVVTELGTNLLRHARKGRLLIAPRPHRRDIEVLSIDEGPGIGDLARSMQDGQSSGSTPGTGLGAVRRLADDFDIHTSVPDGTVCVARIRVTPALRERGTAAADGRGFDDQAFELAAICLPAPGEEVSGDDWTVALAGMTAQLLVADGLGHGPEAARAAAAAMATFAAQPFADLRETVQRLHTGMQTTRGAAVCVVAVDAVGSTVQYAGAGNVVGRVISGVHDKSIITQHGTAGVQIRRPEITTMEWPAHGLLVLHSDGIDTRWKVDRIRTALRMDPVLVAAILLRGHTRHRDDATLVVLRRKE